MSTNATTMQSEHTALVLPPRKLTRNEFNVLCAEFTIDPAIALECDAVVASLRTGNSGAVRLALACEL